MGLGRNDLREEFQITADVPNGSTRGIPSQGNGGTPTGGVHTEVATSSALGFIADKDSGLEIRGSAPEVSAEM